MASAVAGDACSHNENSTFATPQSQMQYVAISTADESLQVFARSGVRLWGLVSKAAAC